MRESDSPRFVYSLALAAFVAFAALTVPVAVSAQETAAPTTQDMQYDDEDDGMDWGWLGLLGLAGLLGLRRREPHYTDTTTTRRT